MSGKNPTYVRKDEETGEESTMSPKGFYGAATTGKTPWIIIAVVGICMLLAGFGGGFGAGWAAGKDSVDTTPCSSTSVQPETVAADNINLLLPYTPINYGANLSNAAVQMHYDQSATLTSAFNVLSVVVSTLAGTNKTFDPNVLRVHSYIHYTSTGQQDVLGKIFNVAQRLMGSPDFMDKMYDIATSFVDIFTYVLNNVGRVSGGHRHLLQANSAQPSATDIAKAVIKSGLQTPELKGALGSLEPIFSDIDTIVDLVADIYYAIRDLATQTQQLETQMDKWHPEAFDAPPQPAPTTVPGLNVSVEVSFSTYSPTLAFEEDDPLAPNNTVVVFSGSRRRLQQIQIPLPAGFTAQPPSSIPDLLIPTVWHVTMYKNADGTYGPPGYDQALAMIQRMIAIANFRLAPAKMQLFILAVRNNPINNPYLVANSRDAWLACSAPGYFSDNCPDMVQNSHLDFPRSINIYINGEQPPTDHVGYAWAPGATDDPMYGHVLLTWTTLNTNGVNNRAAFESGAAGLVHEVMHHLGMPHTFSDASCRDGDAPAVGDTPNTAGPVWGQGFAQQAYLRCLNTWNQALSTNYDTANRNAATRVGIPAAEQGTGFDSCPNNPGNDEIANYITYTYDICLLALGHLTSGQISGMHTITNNANPTLYVWSQYYARMGPPAGSIVVPQPSPTPSPSPPPPRVSPSPPPPSPPPPPPPAANPSPSPPPPSSRNQCQSTTNRGCRCLPTWSVGGVTYSDCVNVPSQTNKGPMCAVDRSNGNCANARNGWWDLCTPCTPSAGNTNTPSPSPPPPAGGGGSSGGNVARGCDPGAITKSGTTCTMKRWKLTGTPGNYQGCANPNNDPNGAWCVLEKGQTSASGTTWDYCADECNPRSAGSGSNNGGGGSSGPSFPAPKQCSRGFTGLPGTGLCNCANGYTISFTGGGRYTNQNGCVAFAETGGQGMCVTKCTGRDRSFNKQVYACDCAA